MILKKLFKNNLNTIDQDTLQYLEDMLIYSDLHIESINNIIKKVSKHLKQTVNHDELKTMIYDILYHDIIKYYQKDHIFIDDFPFTILVSGVNGSGKTTSIAKLAYYYKNQGFRVLLVPCDTFRAAAKEQLTSWAIQLEVTIYPNAQNTKDPAAIAYQALQYAKDHNYELVIIDTAGRLDNNDNLMQELAKIYNTINKFNPIYPHHSLLVVDGTLGKASLNQALAFQKAISLTGLIVTKLDGQAKGGIALAISKELKCPIYFTCVGEKSDDLMEFVLTDYINNLLQ